MRAACCFVLLFGVSATSLEADLSEEASASENSPNAVARVIKMLNDMQAQLEKEAKDDENIMEKMVCWCETNDAAKTASNEANTQKIAMLKQTIEENSEASAGVTEDIAQLEKDIAGNQKELDEATAIREKENAEFSAAEKDQIASIGGLTKAVAAMQAKNQPELAQTSLLQVKHSLRKSTDLGALSVNQREQVMMFLQTNTGSKTHSPGSGEVLGVLKQMQENFESALKDSQTDESEAQKAFNNLKAAKTNEIKASTAMIDSKTQQGGDAIEKLATAKADLEDTTVQLDADTKFLADLKDRCGNMDAEAAERKKARTEEIAAVGEAIGILTSDEARDLMFVQTRSTRHSTRGSTVAGARMTRARTRAARLLLEMSVKTGSPRLAELAVSMRADVFAKIKVAIDEMITQLKKEQKDEVKHRDWCIEELNSNEKQTDDAGDENKALAVELEDIELFVQNVDGELETSRAQIADTHVEIKRAAENREAENKDFQITITDQQATQKILQKALDRLQSFYAKKAALLQAGAHTVAIQAHKQPAGFSKMKKSGGATAVVMMIEGVIKEAKTVETEAVAAEQEAQSAYEAFLELSNKSIDSLNRGIAEKTEAAAKADGTIARIKADTKDNKAHREHLAAYNAELHQSCDFVLKNFEVRQESRSAEIEALGQGKAILSGANI